MKACPYCKSEINKISIEPLSLCEACDEWVIPFEMKDPKKKNYKERNANRFSSLPESRTKLRPVSKKLNIKLKGYQSSKSLQIPNEMVCAKCGASHNLTKHHVAGRSGIYEGIPAIEAWIWLCTSFGNRCHDVVHENPDEAYKEGWLQPEYRGIKHREEDHGKRKKPWLK